MITIDREKFASTLRQLGNERGFNALYWDQCLKELPSLKELYLNGIGNLSLPISSEVCHISLYCKPSSEKYLGFEGYCYN